MTQKRVTLHEAAERLGVHYMTAYRYVRTGRLPAERDGAHWLVDPIELERLAAQPSPRHRGHARAGAPARLAARLVAGDEAGAWSISSSQPWRRVPTPTTCWWTSSRPPCETSGWGDVLMGAVTLAPVLAFLVGGLFLVFGKRVLA